MDSASTYYLVDEINIAHFQRALGEEPKARDQVITILNDLEFDASMNTEQILLRMTEIIDVHFIFTPSNVKFDFFENLFSHKNDLHFGERKIHQYGEKGLFHFRIPFLKRRDMETAKFSGKVTITEDKDPQTGSNFQWHNFIDNRDKKRREDIQNHYGASILPESRTNALEQTLCIGNHVNCHLHFTRGEFDAALDANGDEVDHKKAALKQTEKNKEQFKENFARNRNSILRLTNKIRNTILVNLESSINRAEAGTLVAGRIWRNTYLYDNMIFLKNHKNDIGNLTVDILLDASGSQNNRQETIAAEGYIIAESLTRCQIPVRVSSFCTNSSYTVINLFRDYGEVNNNGRIFNYRASGCNRDGLAIRTALHIMKNSPCEHKMLIVLSDAKPLDPQGISTSAHNPVLLDYSDSQGVNDTALEVRKGRLNGTSILCVFTGLDEDIPSVKKIYGHDFVNIKSLEKFADIVGVLIQNELKNL